MQYVRSIGGSVSKTWNSINPATLSGAIDVIVVEQEDGSLACSPFHVRFGKFSLLRPYEKKVEFMVNDIKQNYSMKLGEGGEAFFVIETFDTVPENLQTSPIVSPAISPQGSAEDTTPSPTLQEPDFLDLAINSSDVDKDRQIHDVSRLMRNDRRAQRHLRKSIDQDHNKVTETKHSSSQILPPQFKRSASEEVLPAAARSQNAAHGGQTQETHINSLQSPILPSFCISLPHEQPKSPPPVSTNEAISRAISLSRRLLGSNIQTFITGDGDLKLDMTGHKKNEDEALRAEAIARKIFAEELEGDYDVGALIGVDEQGDLWIFRSEEAKEAAARKLRLHGFPPEALSDDAVSDPGYQSDEEAALENPRARSIHFRTQSDASPAGLPTLSKTSLIPVSGNTDQERTFAKTLRLTSAQLKALKLKPGANSMSFSVNRATCQGCIYYWSFNVPIVISDIDGTITKSDALGHVLNMIGRDWTHAGVAKLYTDIVANGYNILYLTSRSVGQADTTRAYLNGISQEGFKLPKGPVIMSPDRTIAALRREIYLRKPEVFKMACLRDILSLFSQNRNPFYAGFGNRLTDALSYRSVNIPSTRIFTINSNAEVSLDLLTLNKYKSSYVSMREVVDHFFPPIGLLVVGGGEEFTDFNYWREGPSPLDEFDDSDSEESERMDKIRQSLDSEDGVCEGPDNEGRGGEYEDEYSDDSEDNDPVDEGDPMAPQIVESIEGENALRRLVIENASNDPATIASSTSRIPPIISHSQ